MRNIIIIILLISNMALANNDIGVIAKAPNQSIKAREFAGVNGNHIVNIKNNSGKNMDYKYSFCVGVESQTQCYEKKFVLKPGASFNDHDISYVGVSKNKGQYKITARTQVNDTIHEAYGILTVR